LRFGAGVKKTEARVRGMAKHAAAATTIGERELAEFRFLTAVRAREDLVEFMVETEDDPVRLARADPASN
jgi:hypothetical protein